MTRITINNGSMTEEKAIKEAMEVYDQTGEPVEICNMLGDPVLFITGSGQVIKY